MHFVIGADVFVLSLLLTLPLYIVMVMFEHCKHIALLTQW